MIRSLSLYGCNILCHFCSGQADISFLDAGQREVNSPYKDEIHSIRMRILGILYHEKKGTKSIAQIHLKYL